MDPDRLLQTRHITYYRIELERMITPGSEVMNPSLDTGERSNRGSTGRGPRWLVSLNFVLVSSVFLDYGSTFHSPVRRGAVLVLFWAEGLPLIGMPCPGRP